MSSQALLHNRVVLNLTMTASTSSNFVGLPVTPLTPFGFINRVIDTTNVTVQTVKLPVSYDYCSIFPTTCQV